MNEPALSIAMTDLARMLALEAIDRRPKCSAWNGCAPEDCCVCDEHAKHGAFAQYNPQPTRWAKSLRRLIAFANGDAPTFGDADSG